jgi:hypothetical protein
VKLTIDLLCNVCYEVECNFLNFIEYGFVFDETNVGFMFKVSKNLI